MKRILLFSVLFIGIQIFAQENIGSMMGFKPVIVSDTAPNNTLDYLESKVTEMLTNNGLALTEGDFILEVSVNELSKRFTPTAPPRIQLQLQLTFKTIDHTQGIVLNSINMSASALHTSEEEAYMNAVRGINFRTRDFMNFIDVSKSKLYEYYSEGYATTPVSEPEPEAEAEPVINPEEEETPIPCEPEVDSEPTDNRVELSEGVYVMFDKYELKSSSTDIILTFVNINSNDEKISMKWKNQMIIDDKGKNIKHSNISYYDGSGISDNSLTLVEGVPVKIRIKFSESVTPKVLYFQEAYRDVKVRLNCK